MVLQYEVCVENYDGALTASQKGADTIELCDNLAVGGTTPSYGVLSLCIKNIHTPFTVLIRPRGGNFIYTEEEAKIVTEDILICKKLGYKGIRVGALTLDHQLHEKYMLTWKNVAEDMKISCHMAFDETSNYKKSIDMLLNWGYDGVLTKGGNQGDALSNASTLRELITYAQGKLTIIPGSGITKHSVQELAVLTGAIKLHGTKII